MVRGSELYWKPMSKKCSPWLKVGVLATSAALLSTTPALANQPETFASVDYFQGRQSVPIEVEMPTGGFGNIGSPIYQGACPATFQPIVQRIVGAKAMPNWGVLVERLDDRRVLYSHNENKFFIPASNAKIFTTAAALQRLGPNATVRSQPLRNWVMTTNKRSNNSYAELLLNTVGGPGAVKAAVAELGVNPQGFRVADGSGLSRNNAATPRSLVDTLQAMYRSSNSSLFVSSMPIAGQDGTLARRMKATTAQNNVFAKTGTLRGVRALSGYANTPAHGTVVFSILANDWSRSGDNLVRAIDQLVVQINNMGACD
jgi:D-alanyl-D-alanine carboxypeptidase/D-alanyl-D-alanine-endopeptidase (penicillin-binding protein 4)